MHPSTSIGHWAIRLVRSEEPTFTAGGQLEGELWHLLQSALQLLRCRCLRWRLVAPRLRLAVLQARLRLQRMCSMLMLPRLLLLWRRLLVQLLLQGLCGLQLLHGRLLLMLLLLLSRLSSRCAALLLDFRRRGRGGHGQAAALLPILRLGLRNVNMSHDF